MNHVNAAPLVRNLPALRRCEPVGNIRVMTDSQDKNAPVDLRASDADRERVADRLREAAVDGRQSIRRAYTPAELEEMVRTAVAGTPATFTTDVSPFLSRQIIDIHW